MRMKLSLLLGLSALGFAGCVNIYVMVDEEGRLRSVRVPENKRSTSVDVVNERLSKISKRPDVNIKSGTPSLDEVPTSTGVLKHGPNRPPRPEGSLPKVPGSAEERLSPGTIRPGPQGPSSWLQDELDRLPPKPPVEKPPDKPNFPPQSPK